MSRHATVFGAIAKIMGPLAREIEIQGEQVALREQDLTSARVRLEKAETNAALARSVFAAAKEVADCARGRKELPQVQNPLNAERNRSQRNLQAEEAWVRFLRERVWEAKAALNAANAHHQQLWERAGRRVADGRLGAAAK